MFNSNPYKGPVPYDIQIDHKGMTLVSVAGNPSLAVGTLGDVDKYTNIDTLKAQSVTYTVNLNTPGPVGHLTTLQTKLGELTVALRQRTITAADRKKKILSILEQCVVSADAAFPHLGAGAGAGADTKAHREINDDGGAAIIDRKITANAADKPTVDAVAAFYAIKKQMNDKLAVDPTKQLGLFNSYDLTAFLDQAPDPLPLTVVLANIKNVDTVIKYVKLAIDTHKEVVGSTAVASNNLDRRKREAAAGIINAAAALTPLNGAITAAKTALDAAIDANAANAGVALPDPAIVTLRNAQIALRDAVYAPDTKGTLTTLPDGALYEAAAAAAGGAAGGALQVALTGAAQTWFTAYAPIANGAKIAYDVVVVVGGARKKTRRRSYGRGGRRKSHRRHYY